MNRVHRRYTLEFLTAFVLYLIVLVVSIKLLGTYGNTSWRYPLAVAPVLPAALVLLTFVRFFRRVDELEQRMYLEGFAFAFGASGLATFAYGFLEGVGFPHLDWTFVMPVMIAFWGVGNALARRRYQ
jgi:ABC-type cobalamin transport system permease subunit